MFSGDFSKNFRQRHLFAEGMEHLEDQWYVKSLESFRESGNQFSLWTLLSQEELEEIMDGCRSVARRRFEDMEDTGAFSGYNGYRCKTQTMFIGEGSRHYYILNIEKWNHYEFYYQFDAIPHNSWRLHRNAFGEISHLKSDTSFNPSK